MYYYKKDVTLLTSHKKLDYLLEDGFEEITEEEYNEILESRENALKPDIEVVKKQNEIQYYKELLFASDYKAIKYAEGLLTEEEYAPIRAERQGWRNRINELEEELNNAD